MIFFKKKFFKSGNSTAILFPKEVVQQFLEGYDSMEVKITIVDDKIVIEKFK